MTSGLTLNLINRDETQTGRRGLEGGGEASGPESNCFSSFAAKVPSSGENEGNEKKNKTTEEILCLCATC